MNVKYLFAAIPTRAFADTGLSAADFRTLGVVSYFDRFGSNGSGCYAGQTSLARMCGLQVSTISRSIKKLAGCGYLERQRQAGSRRLQLSVMHDKKADGAALYGAIPLRALADHALAASTFRLLGVISQFHRFGRNGAGCFASQEALARHTGMTVPTVSRGITELCELGYIHKERQENRRRVQYHVAHDLAEQPRQDDAGDTCRNGQVRADEACASGQVGGAETCRIRQVEEIPLNGKRSCGSSPTGQIHSMETALLGRSADENIPTGIGASPLASAHRSLPKFREFVLAGVLTAPEDLRELSIGEIQGIAAQIDRQRRAGAVTDVDQRLAWLLADRALGIADDDNEATGHVLRVAEEVEMFLEADLEAEAG